MSARVTVPGGCQLPAGASGRRRLHWLLRLAGIATVPATLFAHAVVHPAVSTPGAYERYVLRVPNERDLATTRVELDFPADVRVVSFADVPGWTLDVVSDSTGRITGAVWTGVLPPQRFVELPFVAVNPAEPARLAWPAYQTYADGERVAWTGPQGGATPASLTEIGAAGGAQAGSSAVVWMAGAALLISLIGLGLALRRGADARP